MEAVNLPTFLKIVKRKEIKYLCYLCKKRLVATKLRGPGAKLGPVSSRQGGGVP